MLITQQPGSIPHEILSQGDNWFIFHLLSAGDLDAVKRANAHFSDDILSSLLNEPIPGQGVFWSSVGGTRYPIPLRVMSFEQIYAARDPEYRTGAAMTFATDLRARTDSAMREASTTRALAGAEEVKEDSPPYADQTPPDEPPDVYETYKGAAIRRFGGEPRAGS